MIEPVSEKECRMCNNFEYGKLCKYHLADLISRWNNFLDTIDYEFTVVIGDKS